MTPKSKPFQSHIHLFRALAIVLVVLQHVVPAFDWSEAKHLGLMIEGISDESSIIFVFIAGFLFQYLSHSFDFKKYYWQKFKNVLLPYVICSIPALVVFTVFTQREGVWQWFYDLDVVSQVALFLVTGKHLAPYWFIPMIALYYVAAPVLNYADKKVPGFYWLIIPFTVLSFWVGRDGVTGPLQKALYMVPVYLSGMWVSHMGDRFARFMRYAVWPFSALMALAYVAYVMEWATPPYYIILLKLALSFLLVHLLSVWNFKVGPQTSYVATISFGIYFVHSYVITAIKLITAKVAGGAWSFSGFIPVDAGVLPVLLLLVLAFGLSVLVVYLAKLIFGRYSKMIVGA